MPEITRDAIAQEIRARRLEADALLTTLLRDKAEIESRMAGEHRRDPLCEVTGCSALDNAIKATRAAIERLDDCAERLRTSLTAQDRALIAEFVKA